jgi:hypothetical protein
MLPSVMVGERAGIVKFCAAKHLDELLNAVALWSALLVIVGGEVEWLSYLSCCQLAWQFDQLLGPMPYIPRQLRPS